MLFLPIYQAIRGVVPNEYVALLPEGNLSQRGAAPLRDRVELMLLIDDEFTGIETSELQVIRRDTYVAKLAHEHRCLGVEHAVPSSSDHV